MATSTSLRWPDMGSLEALICEEIMWATKAVHSIEAGYVRLETAEEGRWRPARIGDNAYFACAVFRDGRHIPLPLLLPGGPIDTLQEICALRGIEEVT